MAIEPKPNADADLKAYAQRRRAQAGDPLAMPPHTRAFLQSEIARTFGKPGEPTHAALPARWWARLVWGGAGLAVLVVLALLAWPPPRSARQRPLGAAPPFQRVAVSKALPLSGTSPNPVSAAPAVALQSPVPAPAPVAPTQPAVSSGYRAGGPSPIGAGNSNTARRGLAAGAPAVRFVQLDLPAPSQRQAISTFASARPAVLTAFDLERTGDHLRIIDADGSVYRGQVLAGAGGPAEPDRNEATGSLASAQPARPPGRPAMPAAPPIVAPEIAGSQAPLPAEYTFWVAGTNRTLQQRVVLRGQFVPGTPVTRARTPGARLRYTRLDVLRRQGSTPVPVNQSPTGLPVAVSGAAGAAAQKTADALGRYATSRPFLQGEVTVGGTNRFRIEAVPLSQSSK